MLTSAALWVRTASSGLSLSGGGIDADAETASASGDSSPAPAAVPAAPGRHDPTGAATSAASKKSVKRRLHIVNLDRLAITQILNQQLINLT